MSCRTRRLCTLCYQDNGLKPGSRGCSRRAYRCILVLHLGFPFGYIDNAVAPTAIREDLFRFRAEHDEGDGGDGKYYRYYRLSVWAGEDASYE